MALGLGMVMGLVVGLGVDGMQPMVLYLDSLKCLKVGGYGRSEGGSV